jgi:hypothetical protein
MAQPDPRTLQMGDNGRHVGGFPLECAQPCTHTTASGWPPLACWQQVLALQRARPSLLRAALAPAESMLRRHESRDLGAGAEQRPENNRRALRDPAQGRTSLTSSSDDRHIMSFRQPPGHGGVAETSKRGSSLSMPCEENTLAEMPRGPAVGAPFRCRRRLSLHKQ